MLEQFFPRRVAPERAPTNRLRKRTLRNSGWGLQESNISGRRYYGEAGVERTLPKYELKIHPR